MRPNKARFDPVEADSLHQAHRSGLLPTMARAVELPRLTATAAPPLIVRVAMSRVESVTQFFSVGLIDAEHRTSDILDRTNIQPVCEHVTHREQTIEDINKLSSFQLRHSFK